MVSLKEACDIVLAAHPDQYIHVVNEFDEVFLFVMVRKGDIIEQYGFPYTTEVFKSDGHFIEDVLTGPELDTSYLQYVFERPPLTRRQKRMLRRKRFHKWLARRKGTILLP